MTQSNGSRSQYTGCRAARLQKFAKDALDQLAAGAHSINIALCGPSYRIPIELACEVQHSAKIPVKQNTSARLNVCATASCATASQHAPQVTRRMLSTLAHSSRLQVGSSEDGMSLPSWRKPRNSFASANCMRIKPESADTNICMQALQVSSSNSW